MAPYRCMAAKECSMKRSLVGVAVLAIGLSFVGPASAQVVAYHTATSASAVIISDKTPMAHLHVPDGSYVVFATMDVDNDAGNYQTVFCQLWTKEGQNNGVKRDDHA